MNLRFAGNTIGRMLCVCLAIIANLLIVSVCSATVNKNTISINVSTAKEDNWYDWYQSNYVKSTNPLHTFVVCDGTSYTSNTQSTIDKYYKNSLCGSDGKYNDYLYTDTADESNTYPPEQNFTIKASASASSGSMTGVKFEWVGKLTGLPASNGSSWTDTSKGIGSYTCPNTGSCTICVQGGSCAHPVIPQEYLSVYSDGAQRRFYFRVTFSSSSGDKVTTGFDDAADKFHLLVICGPKCKEHECSTYAPVIVPDRVVGPSDLCSGLNDKNGYYTVSWKATKMPSNTVQTYYKVSLRKKGTTAPVYTSEANSAAQSFKIPSSWLSYGTTYEWQVQAKYSGQGCTWNVISPWSSGATDIVVPKRYPVPNFNVKNTGGSDCLVGGCYQAENINFNASSSVISTPSATYNWTLDGAGYSGISFSKTFNTKDHSVTLKVTDSDGHSCSSPQKNFTLGTVPEACAGGLTASLSGLYTPANLCNGLNDTDGYYALSWKNDNLPTGAKQTHYEVTVRNKANPADTHTAAADSSSTLFKVPTSWINYSNTYEWQVKTKIVSSDGKCTWDLVSPWSSGGLNIVVPHKYPVPKFTVKDQTNTLDCLAGKCYQDEDINFNASGSTYSTPSATFSWLLDGANYSGISFKKSLSDPDHSVNVKVTDSDGHSCVSPTSNFSLMNQPCPPSPATVLGNVACNDFCNGLDYTLLWNNNNMPAGAKQIHYDVTVRNKANAADTHTSSADSPTTIFSIPGGWLDYSSTYEWQVKTIIKTSNGKCTWNVTSPWSSGANNIVTPNRFPTSAIKVMNPTNTNCLTGGCFMMEEITFDASDPAINPANFTYDWNVDGSPFSGVSFVLRFDSKDHSFYLKATDKTNGLSCTSSTKNFSLERSQATWNEIAP